MSTLPVFRSYRGVSAAATFAAGRFCCFGAGTGAGAGVGGTGADWASIGTGRGFVLASFRAGDATGKVGSFTDGSCIDARHFTPPISKLCPNPSTLMMWGMASTAAPPAKATGAIRCTANTAGFFIRPNIVLILFPKPDKALSFIGQVRFVRHDRGIPADGRASPRSMTTAAICGSITSTSSVA